MDSPGRKIIRVAFVAENKLGIRKNTPERHLNSGIEGALVARALVEAQQVFQVLIRSRTTIRTARQGRDDFLGAWNFIRLGGGMANENAPAARRVARSGWVIRTRDVQARHVRNGGEAVLVTKIQIVG